MSYDRLSNPWRRNFLQTGIAGAMSFIAAPLGTTVASAERKVPSREAGQPSSPDWTKDLIIYEFGSTRAFTSPKGPGSGTFGSMREKLPYLQELGINGIWMDPYSLCDHHRFFYNMWNRYAVVEPDKFDPVLGTEAEFKALIDEAHQRGIKIFLDIKTHGIMPYSPVVKQHPEWFRGGQWRMLDYDWKGGHPDLEDWWVKIWSDCVEKYRIDGFRLDVDIYRADLWARIRRNAPAGHPIIIFEENNYAIPGVSDFDQRDIPMMDWDATAPNPTMLKDIAGFWARRFGSAGQYKVRIQYADDGSRVEGSTDAQGAIRVRLDGRTADKTARRYSEFWPDGIPDVQLTLENVGSRPIEDIEVQDDAGGIWRLHPRGRDGHQMAMEGQPPSLQLYLATLGHGYPTIMLSCHDQGWEGFPLDKSPYVAQGSRSMFGYSVLFAPAIPIFFSGEEFNATFRPLPWQSPHLYGGKDPGKGTWLYGCMLDWDELNQPEHRSMYEDVKKMIAVRKREADVLTIAPEKERPNLMAVKAKGAEEAPIPYVRWNHERAILVAGNRNTDQSLDLSLHLPLQEIGLAGHASYKVTELWPGDEGKVYSEKDLTDFACSVKPDKTAGGGLRVFKIQPI